MNLLSNPDLEAEMIGVLVANLRIPLPSTQTVASRKEIFFPAHLIGSIMIKCLDMRMYTRLGNLMEKITTCNSY